MGARIAILLHADEQGGAERTICKLAETLAGRDLDVDVVLMTGADPRPGVAPPGTRLVTLGARRVATSVRRLARYLADERPDVMVGALTHTNVAAVVARRLARSPARLVMTEHIAVSRFKLAPHHPRERLLPWFAARFYRHADRIVCVSSGVADDLAELTGVPRAEIAVIPNPIDKEEVLRAAAGPTPHPWLEEGQPPVVLAAGRLEGMKAFEDLIDAIARVREHRPVRLIIVGEGRERPRLEAEARRLGIEDDVLLPGYDPNPHRWMGRAAVVALSSIREGHGMVLAEALMLSRPVVATDCESGPREVLDGGRLGRLVPPRDPAALAEALLKTLEDPPRPVPAEAVAHYDPERVADAYLELLLPQAEPRARPAAASA